MHYGHFQVHSHILVCYFYRNVVHKLSVTEVIVSILYLQHKTVLRNTLKHMQIFNNDKAEKQGTHDVLCR